MSRSSGRPSILRPWVLAVLFFLVPLTTVSAQNATINVLPPEPGENDQHVTNGGFVTYTVEFIAHPGQGPNVVVEVSYAKVRPDAMDPPPPAEVTIKRQGSETSEPFGSGTLQGFNQPLSKTIPSGSYSLGVRASVNGKVPGVYFTDLVLVARQPGSSSSSPGAGFAVRITVDNTAPTASFTYTCNGQNAINQQCSTLTVAFDGTGSSANDPGQSLTYAWDFGDGSSSTQPAPTHVYDAEGSYDVQLTVSDGAATASLTRTVVVAGVPAEETNRAPTGVDFEYTTNGLTAQFTGTAVDPEEGTLTFDWTFGDGQTGTGASISHTYGAAGTYDVTLVARDTFGASGSKTRSVAVSAPPPPPPPTSGSPTPSSTSPTASPTSPSPTASSPSPTPTSTSPTPAPVRPGPVSNLRFETAQTTALVLSWNALPGEVTYRLYRNADATGTPTLRAIVNTNRFQDTQLTPDTLYFYRVSAVNAQGEGPLSAAVQARTLPPDDVEPPSNLTLRVGQVTGRTASLEWSAATDNVRVVHYRVHRGNESGFEVASRNLVGTSPDLFFTDRNLEPNRTYYYRVQAVDGAGNRGAPSAELAVRTRGDLDETAPRVRAVQVFVRTNATDVAWQTDETARCELVVRSGAAAVAQRDAGTEASFRLNLGRLAAGGYNYTISCRDARNNVGLYEGHFRLGTGAESPAVQRAADEETTSQVSQVAGVELSSGSLYFVDANGDGRFDSVDDASGRLVKRNGVPDVGVFLLQSPATQRFVVIAPDQHTVSPVAPQNAVVRRQDVMPLVRTVVLEVPQKSGWIVFEMEDPHPALPILSFDRGDGARLPVSFAWREGGKIHFMDDPGTTYAVTFDRAAGEPNDTEAGPGSGRILWIVLAAGAALALLVMAVGLRRRRA